MHTQYEIYSIYILVHIPIDCIHEIAGRAHTCETPRRRTAEIHHLLIINGKGHLYNYSVGIYRYVADETCPMGESAMFMVWHQPVAGATPANNVRRQPSCGLIPNITREDVQI